MGAYTAPSAAEALSVSSTETDAMLVGRVAADIATIGVGVVEMLAGVGTIGGGAVLSCIGTACVGAVATTAAGAAVTGYGAVTTAEGAMGLGDNLGRLLSKGQPGGKSKQYKFYGTDELAKRLGVSRNEFHRGVKPEILGDKGIAEFMQKINTTNPDFGVDAYGNIVLRNPETGQVVNTNIPYEDFGYQIK